MVLSSVVFVAGLLVVGLSPWMSRGGSAEGQAPELILYTGENFTGHSFTVTGTLLDMPPGSPEGTQADEAYGWNDNVKSIKVVKGTWRLCQNGRLNTKMDDTPVAALTADLAKAKGASDGWSCLVSATSKGTVEYPTVSSGVWGMDISSIELVSDENLPDWGALAPK